MRLGVGTQDWSGDPLANKTRSTFLKRQKEVSRQARQKEKAAKRLEAKQKLAEGGEPQDPAEAEDPDLAGIVLGPQPPPGESDEESDEDSADEDEADEK